MFRAAYGLRSVRNAHACSIAWFGRKQRKSGVGDHAAAPVFGRAQRFGYCGRDIRRVCKKDNIKPKIRQVQQGNQSNSRWVDHGNRIIYAVLGFINKRK